MVDKKYLTQEKDNDLKGVDWGKIKPPFAIARYFVKPIFAEISDGEWVYEIVYGKNSGYDREIPRREAMKLIRENNLTIVDNQEWGKIWN